MNLNTCSAAFPRTERIAWMLCTHNDARSVKYGFERQPFRGNEVRPVRRQYLVANAKSERALLSLFDFANLRFCVTCTYTVQY